MTIVNKLKYLYILVEVEVYVSDGGVETSVEDDSIPETVVVKVPFDLRYGSYARVQLNEQVLLYLNGFKREIDRTIKKINKTLDYRVSFNIVNISPKKFDATVGEDSVAIMPTGKSLSFDEIKPPTKKEMDEQLKEVKKSLNEFSRLASKVNPAKKGKSK